MTQTTTRRTQAATSYRKYTIGCIGDSTTMIVPGSSGTMRSSDYWPEVTAKVLRDNYGCLVKARNFGISGHHSRQMWERIACMTQYEVPDIGCIWSGTNDASNGIAASAGTQAVPLGTQQYIQAMVNFLLAAGTTKVLVLGNHFLSYNLGGDTAGSTLGTASFATIIAAQQAAVAAFAGDSRGTVLNVDLFTYVKSVLAGTAPTLNAVAGNQATVWFPQYKLAPTDLSASNYPQPIPPTVYTLGFGIDSTPTAPHGWGIQVDQVNQTLTLSTTGTLGGTYTLSYNGQTTAANTFSDTAATVQGRVQGLSSVGAGNILVTGTTPTTAGGTLTFTFAGALRGSTLRVSVNGSGLTGTAAAATMSDLPNLHYNEIGNVLVANAVLSVIQAQSGWVNALQT